MPSGLFAGLSILYMLVVITLGIGIGRLIFEIIARLVCHRVENAIEKIVSSEVDDMSSASMVSNPRPDGIYGSLPWLSPAWQSTLVRSFKLSSDKCLEALLCLLICSAPRSEERLNEVWLIDRVNRKR